MISIICNERAFGLNDSGAMTADKVGSFLDVLPSGLSEIYSHPATRHWEERPMPPHYQVDGEYKAFIDPANLAKVKDLGIRLTTFAAEAERA